ncbi:hypothetical protein L249_6206 [Ophiocordyceps polyrhachis-furcata BCC 54312]|uniref:cyclin-dependent kinase n=1 Tax=Ophiocordyceps polyrhachis-furcata BCC 54312 TaxID=1330021 RepID=A0A367L148_9HYPO|nr:hypothetical protein L249_6206 [Ophiocordyceps polyrhachis-furcata BCC 54312]
MRDIGGSDDHGERVRPGRGVTSSQRPGSPPRDPIRGHHRQQPSSHDGHRSRDRPRHRPVDLVGREPDVEDLIPGYRASRVWQSEPGEGKSSRRSRSRDHDVPSSSPTAKRYRDSTHSPDDSHRKRSKKLHSPTRYSRGRSRDPESRKRRRFSPHHHAEPSHRRHPHSYGSPSRSEEAYARYKQPSFSRSPIRQEVYSSRTASRDLRSSRHPPPPFSRSPSPTRDYIREPTHRPPSPSPRSSRSFQPYGGGVPHEYPGSRPPYRQGPPRSPPPYRGHRREELPPEAHFSSRSELDDEMASRSSYRAGNNPLYTHNSFNGNETRGSDARGYSLSPARGSSYQNSPSLSSPYGPYRGGGGGGGGSGSGGWAGQYSPQHHHQSQYHHGHGSYSGMSGPPEHHHSRHPHSPSYSTPPQPSYAQSGHREGYRSGSFRGGSFGRGGYRGSAPQNLHWGSAKQSTHSHRSYEFPSEDSAGRRQSVIGGPVDGNKEVDMVAPAMEEDLKESSKTSEDEVSDPSKRADAAADCRAAPSNPAPSQAKFSFSFKPSAKPTPTAPKPEISQKLNALPQRRETEYGSPSSAPTEPASTRPRADSRTAPDGPQHSLRTRKVRKMVRRQKARPFLTPELAASESVFFRKPGNESVVGSGTYGKVFKGLNVYTKGLVALKRIRMEGERDGFPVTAVREIKLLQSLRHTNIVNLQEVMVEKNDCFMVFEYLSHDLTGLLNHPTFKLEPAQRKHLAKQLFEGLDYLHTRGVLHRDIKAANILVSNDGILKLADFGLARFYAKRHQLDYTNRVITIWYRSPELLLGETQYTAAVDIWSAACVMVEIFTRHAIFAGDGTELSQLDKIYNILGTPNRQEWPGLVDMAWFELLRPTVKRKSMFADKYEDKLTPAVFDLLSSMFRYDPARRPNAAEALRHQYFTSEAPLPRQAVELTNIDGEWHEFESKALRKENERREREARKAAKDASRDGKDKKRAPDGQGRERESKRPNMN